MTPRAILVASATAIGGTLSACGGSSGPGTAFTPPPPQTPAPAPAPTPAAEVALIAPQLTAAPSSPVATPGGPSFRDPQVDTAFPLILTAADWGHGGDKATTEQGGTVAVDAGSGNISLTLNNRSLGVEQGNDGSALSGGRTLDTSYSADLDYARYGFWDIHGGNYSAVFSVGGWLAGYITPAANVPVSGNAVYRGSVTGQYLYTHDYYEYLFGKVELTANFGDRSIDGRMTEMSVTSSDTTINSPPNDIGFTATIDPSRNLFVGTTRFISVPSTNNADATGSITGRFFGPSAQEVGAVWTLQDGATRLIGSFGARQ